MRQKLSHQQSGEEKESDGSNESDGADL